MTTPASFDFAKFDYQIDPKTYEISQVTKGKKKPEKSDELINLLAKCQKELQKSVSSGQVLQLANVNALRSFTTELETFLKTKQQLSKTPYKLRQRPEDKKLESQIAQLKDLNAEFATISLKGMVKKVTRASNEVTDILALGKALLSMPKQQQTAPFQEGQKAYVDAILGQKDLSQIIAQDPAGSWLECFLQENPSKEAVLTLLERLAPYGDNEKIKTFLETEAWLSQRFEKLPLSPAQRLFVSFLIDFRLPSRENEPFLKETLQQGLTEMVEGKSNFKWLETFVSQTPNDKEVKELVNTLKSAVSLKLISSEAEKPLQSLLLRFDALAADKKTGKIASVVRLEMAHCSQLLAPQAKSRALQELYTESIERMFTPQGSLQWVKRFIQEKPTDAEVKTALALLKFIATDSLADSQTKTGAKLLIKSFDDLTQNQKQLSGKDALGLAYGIEVKLAQKPDQQTKLLLQEGLARLFAIEGSLHGFSRLLAQEPSKTQVQELISILSSLCTDEKLNKKMQGELKGVVSTYGALLDKSKMTSQEALKVAFALHVDLASVQNEKLRNDAITLLLPDILEPLLGQDLSEKQVLELLPFLDVKIVNRYQQLQAMPKELLGMSYKEMLQLAHFIEVKLAKTLQATGPYIKKGQGQTTGLARSLLVDNTSGDVYILSKRKVEVLDASGTSKRITSAIRLPTKTQAQLVAQAVNKHDEAITKPQAYQQSLALGKEELITHKKLENGPGIWPLLFWFEYSKKIDEKNEIPKLTAIYAFAEGNLDSLKETITGPELLSAAKALIEGLAHMHALGFVHADLKLENALFKRDAQGNLIVGWSDFGLTIHIASGQKSEIAFVSGYYGTFPYTAPEVLTQDNFDGDLQKADVWALGCTLYQLCYKEALPWGGLIAKYHNENSHLSAEESAEFAGMIEAYVAEELQKLPAEQERSPDDRLKALTFQMLRADPAVRIDMTSAKKEIQAIVT